MSSKKTKKIKHHAFLIVEFMFLCFFRCSLRAWVEQEQNIEHSSCIDLSNLESLNNSLVIDKSCPND